MTKIYSPLFVLMVFLWCSLGGEPVTWAAPATLSSTNVNASNPLIAQDANGNGVVIWIENGVLKAMNNPAGGDWTNSPVTISTSGVSSPQLVVDPNGNATAVWIQNSVVQTASMPAEGSWDAPATLSSTGAVSPSLAVDPNGNVVALWTRNGAIESSTQLFGGDWSSPVDVLATTAADSPQVAIGANGMVVAVWHEVINSLDTIVSANKPIKGTWSTSQNISNAATNSVYPVVAVDPNGNAMVLWYTYTLTGSTYSNVIVQAASLPINGTWSSPTNLSEAGMGNPANFMLRAAFDSNGYGIAVWTLSLDGATYHVQDAILYPTGSWTTLVENFISLYSLAFGLNVNTQGNAFVTAMTTVSPGSIVIQSINTDIESYRPNFWCIPVTISTETENGYPQIASSISGGTTHYVAAVWVSFNGSTTVIQAATATGAVIQPPSTLSVVQDSTNFGVYTDYFNTLSLSPSPSSEAIGYLIFRDGIFLADIGNTLQYVDHNQVQNGTVTYSAVSYDMVYDQSLQISAPLPTPSRFKNLLNTLWGGKKR